MSRVQELKRNLSIALQDSSWEDALAVLGKLVEVEGSQPAYHNQIGDILLKSGRREEAMGSFMRGICAYRDLGMYPNGAALCKKVLRLDPEQSEAIWILGELKARQGFLADGAENMLEALRGFSENSEFGRENLLERLDAAEELLAGNREVLEFVATSYARMEEQEKARATTLRIADLEDREGKREKAAELRRLAQELSPDGDEAASPPPVAEIAPEPETTAEPEPDPAPAAVEERAAEPVDAPAAEPMSEPIEVPAPIETIAREAATEALAIPADPSYAEAVESEVPASDQDATPEAETIAESEPTPVEPEPPTLELDEDLSSPGAVLEEILQDDATVGEGAASEPATAVEIDVPPSQTDPGVSLPPGATLTTESAASAEEGFESFTFSAEAPEAVAPESTAAESDAAPAAGPPTWPGLGEEGESEPPGDDEAAHLAESMLEMMDADSDLPEVEILGESGADEDLLSTRQVVDSLSQDLVGAPQVEILHDEDAGEAETDPPSAEAEAPKVDAEENANRLAELMTTRPPAAPGDLPDPDVELVNISDSLAEADGDWDSPAPPVAEDESDRAHHEIHLDDDAKPLSFGLTTTAGEALQTDDIDEVVGEFRRRMKEQMGSMAPEERYQLGVSYMEMGLHEEALEEFEHTLEHKVLGAKTREWMARCLLALERPREIVLLLQTRLDSESYPQKSMVELYFLLGEAYEKLQAYDLALDAFTKVYSLDPDFREVQAKLAKLTNAS